MELVIRGHHLPGRDVGEWRDVHVGMQVAHAPSGLVPADAENAEWTTSIEVHDGDFRGPAVQGPRGGRFVYLTWGEGAGDHFVMFRRAKLALTDLPVASGTVVAEVDLTADDGTPRCARLRPPALTWA